MYKLERLNVVKVVATEHERNKLLAKGFTEVKEQEKSRKKPQKKKEEKPQQEERLLEEEKDLQNNDGEKAAI